MEEASESVVEHIAVVRRWGVFELRKTGQPVFADYKYGMFWPLKCPQDR